MRLRRLDDVADPRVHDYTGLTDVQLRRVREPAEGIFIAEGEKVIRRADEAGYRMRSVLCAERWVGPLADLLETLDIDVFVASEPVLRAVTGFRVHRGALAAMERRPLPTLEAVATSARRLVVMEDLVDHTNVGAVLRSAAALGFDAAVTSPGCADPLYRRSVKVSMGAVFSLPWTVADPWPQSLATLRGAGHALLALTPDPEATPIDDVPADLAASCAVLVGTEGDGLSPAALNACDLRVRIPMSRGVDSLNAAAASAVACYALTRQP